jgi:hypothetical protein
MCLADWGIVTGTCGELEDLYAASSSRQALLRLPLELTFNMTQDAWSVKLGVDVMASPEQHMALLVEAVGELENLALEQPKRRAVLQEPRRCLKRVRIL